MCHPTSLRTREEHTDKHGKTQRENQGDVQSKSHILSARSSACCQEIKDRYGGFCVCVHARVCARWVIEGERIKHKEQNRE